MADSEQTQETQACIDRLDQLFSACPKAPFNDGAHTWDTDAKECLHCGAKFPYAGRLLDGVEHSLFPGDV